MTAYLLHCWPQKQCLWSTSLPFLSWQPFLKGLCTSTASLQSSTGPHQISRSIQSWDTQTQVLSVKFLHPQNQRLRHVQTLKTHRSFYLSQGPNTMSILWAHLLDWSPYKICWQEMQCCYIHRPLTGPDCVLTHDSTAKQQEHLLGRKRTVLWGGKGAVLVKFHVVVWVACAGGFL